MLDIPEITDVDIVFGGADEHLPEWADLPEGFHHLRGPFCHAASMLFYQGGEITDCGLRFRDGVDQARAIRLLWALLRSYRTKHEHKIGGVGFLLSQWCEEAA